MSKRNMVTTILLFVFTCGIYNLYLVYALSSDLNQLSYDNKNEPVLDVVLSVVTCGIYQIYWYYKIGKQVENYQTEMGMRTNSLAILCPILAVFSAGIISSAILVSELNNCIDEKEHI